MPVNPIQFIKAKCRAANANNVSCDRDEIRTMSTKERIKSDIEYFGITILTLKKEVS
jgi:hypothetical protein